MEWNQIDFSMELWRIPITKNQDFLTLPLTAAAMEILHRRRNDEKCNERWVFPSDRIGKKTGVLGPMISPHKAWKRIIERAGIEDLRIHDLRSTAGSYMAIAGISPIIIGKALGHRSPASTAIYTRLTQDPVRQALEKAQAALAKTTEPIPRNDNVVTFERRRHQ
jgi:integrase